MRRQYKLTRFAASPDSIGIRRDARRVSIILELCFCGLILPAAVGLSPIFIGGCGDKDKGKFTEEELAKMPLAQREGFPACSGGLVLKVNDDVLTMEEIIGPTSKFLEDLVGDSDLEEFKERIRPQFERFVWNRITDLLLYQQAKKDLPENAAEPLEKAVEEELSKFVAGFGGDYAVAERALKEKGLDWDKFREEQKKFIVTQLFLSEQLKDDEPVTHRELLEYYNEIKNELYATGGTIEFRLIDLPGRQAGIQPEDGGQETEDRAATVSERKLAEQLIERLKKGEDFGELAKEYSYGHRAAQGGLWNPVQLGSLAEPYDVLEKAAAKLQVGQIAGPVETDGHIFIMKLESKREQNFKPFEEVQHEVEKRLIFKRRQDTLENLVDKYVKQADIGDTETFIDMCLDEIYRKYNPDRIGGEVGTQVR